MGGFSSSFSSGYICRFCDCKYEDLQDNIHDYTGKQQHEKWTVSKYDDIVQRFECLSNETENEKSLSVSDALNSYYNEDLDADEEDGDSDSELEENQTDNCGLKFECILNRLQSFHCVDSMPPDCLHDLFEGGIAQDLLGIIRILSSFGWFTIEEYNIALQKFPLSTRDLANKPQNVPTNKTVKKLIGKAVSQWLHIRIFLFILFENGWIGDEGNKVIQLAILLTDLSLRITAEKIEAYEIDVLEEVIVKYLDLRKEMYEEFPVLRHAIPKLHFLTHYADYVRRFGPPLGFWTGRYESKHRIAKSITECCKNFINIALTVSVRQQLRMASTYYNGMFSDEEFRLPVLIYRKGDLSNAEEDTNLKNSLNESDIVCMEIFWNDRCFKEGTVIIIDRKDKLEMTVGLVKCIVVRKNIVYFVVRRSKMALTPLKFFKSTVVEDKFTYVAASRICDLYPLKKYGSDRSFYIILHHHISFKYD